MSETNTNSTTTISEVEYEVVNKVATTNNNLDVALVAAGQKLTESESQIVYVPTIDGHEEQMIQESQINYDSETGLPMFNIDKLAQDIDAVVGDKLQFAEGKLNEMAQGAAGAAKLITDSMVEQYKGEVREVFGNIKEQLLEEVRQGRAVVNIVDGSGAILNILSEQENDHHKFQDVVKSLAIHHKVLLVGPAGTGKTTMIEHMAERMNQPFYKYSCSRDSSVHDLIGYKQPASEQYLETPFIKAYENGGIFLVDEYDAMSGDMALFFNGIADGSSSFTIPHRDANPVAKKHKDFFLVMCGNTYGKGSTDYSGRDFQDLALMDRFRFCTHTIGYHTSLEKALLSEYYEFGMKLRATLEKKDSYLSTRNISDMVKMIKAKVHLKDIVEMICQTLEDAEKTDVIKQMTPHINAFRSSVMNIPDGILLKDDKGNDIDFKALLKAYPPKDQDSLAKLRMYSLKLHDDFLKLAKQYDLV